MPLPDLAPWQWIAGVAAALLIGIAKTGIPGVGTLAVPIMVFAVGDARRSAGWLLPILCVADVIAVWMYRRQAHARALFALLPWVLVGLVAGAVALAAPERLLRPLVATIVLVMIAVQFWQSRRRVAPGDGTLRAATYGSAAGFATMIANAAAPVMNLYLLARRLPKNEFVGTGAWFFLVVNLCKLPIHAGYGLIDARSLTFDALLVPFAIGGTLIGRALLHRIPQRTFDSLVLMLTVLAAALLFVPR